MLTTTSPAFNLAMTFPFVGKEGSDRRHPHAAGPFADLISYPVGGSGGADEHVGVYLDLDVGLDDVVHRAGHEAIREHLAAKIDRVPQRIGAVQGQLERI